MKFPSKLEKETFVTKEVNFLLGSFSNKLSDGHIDQISLNFKLPGMVMRDRFKELEGRGYQKSDSDIGTVYHLYNEQSAVSSNVSYDKNKDIVAISMNF